MRLSGRQHLVTAACFVRTPSPTICLSECRGLSGRQHLVTAACFVRTPSPTFCLSECRGLSGRRGRRPLQFAYRNAEDYRDVSTSSPRRASQGRHPLHFRRKDTVPCRNKNIGSGRQNYRDVEDAVPYILLIGMPGIIGTSAPRPLGVLRKDAVPYNSVAPAEQIPYSGIITFRFISLSEI